MKASSLPDDTGRNLNGTLYTYTNINIYVHKIEEKENIFEFNYIRNKIMYRIQIEIKEEKYCYPCNILS